MDRTRHVLHTDKFDSNFKGKQEAGAVPPVPFKRLPLFHETFPIHRHFRCADHGHDRTNRQIAKLEN